MVRILYLLYNFRFPACFFQSSLSYLFIFLSVRVRCELISPSSQTEPKRAFTAGQQADIVTKNIVTLSKAAISSSSSSPTLAAYTPFPMPPLAISLGRERGYLQLP